MREVVTKIPNVIETLKRSRVLLQERGLCKGAARNMSGNICVTTAVQIALEIRDNEGNWAYVGSYSKKRIRQSEVYKCLSDFITKRKLLPTKDLEQYEFSPMSIVQCWNDIKEHTLTNVMGTLQLVAKESETE